MGELRAKLEELRQLEQELADAEMGLVALRADLYVFEQQYLRPAGD